MPTASALETWNKQAEIQAVILKDKSEVAKRERKDWIQETEKALKYVERIEQVE